MEGFPNLGVNEAGEERDDLSSTHDPPPTIVLDAEEFERRVNKLCEMMLEDLTVRDRLIAETYVNIASIEMGVRGAMQIMQEQGAAGFLKGMMFSRKGR